LVRMASSWPKNISTSTAKITTCAYSAARLDIEYMNVQGLPWSELQRCQMGRLPRPKLRLWLWFPSQKIVSDPMTSRHSEGCVDLGCAHIEERSMLLLFSFYISCN
jgi:hypothetical protein